MVSGGRLRLCGRTCAFLLHAAGFGGGSRGGEFSSNGFGGSTAQTRLSYDALSDLCVDVNHPRTQTVTETRTDGTVLTSVECVPGLAGLDWYWLSGVFMFALVLWSFFRFIGVVFKR